nr:putative reverse transcriptase domain-containing protein [Tanacetum cinerariifolium]
MWILFAAPPMVVKSDDDDDDTAPMDSQPHEPRGSPHDTHHITFRGNEGAVGLIRWIEKTELVFTVSNCTKANKVVFPAATFQDQALTWWNSQVATSRIEVVTRKTWTEMKVMMTEEFCPPEEIQRMESRDCWSKVVATGANAQPVVTCYECGEKGHIKTNCPARNNPGRGGARGQAYALRDGDQNLGPNVVTESCMKVKKYVDRGSYFFVARVIEKERAERRLEDVPVICKFSDVFPEDLPGLPPPRQVEFKIELVPEAAPVVHAPYRLAPSKMKELAKQLQELSDKGFIRPS